MILTGEPPSPFNPPPGCAFHPRCPLAFERCRRETAAAREESGAGRRVLGGRGMSETYDYIVVGAGSAGCLLANRLSADPRNSRAAARGGRARQLDLAAHSRRLSLRDRRQALGLALSHPAGKGPQRPRHRLSPRPRHRRLLRDQRHDLHARPGRRLRRLAPARAGGLGLGRRAALFPAPRGSSRRQARAAWRGRRMAGRAPAHLLGNPRRRARRGGGGRHPQDRRLQSRRQRRLRLFRGQPAARPARQRRQGVPEARAVAQEPEARHRRAGAPAADRERPRRRASNMPATDMSRARAREARSSWPPARSARRICWSFPAIGRPDALARIGRAVLHAIAGRRREPAGPSAIAHDLPHRGRAHAQRRIPVACSSAR